jgi:hypothetical protein
MSDKPTIKAFLVKEKEAEASQNSVSSSPKLKNSQTWELIKKALTTSTLHRLGSIFDNESLPLQFIIGVLFSASAALCFYHIVNTIISFASNSVLTVSSINYEIPAEFPGRFSV